MGLGLKSGSDLVSHGRKYDETCWKGPVDPNNQATAFLSILSPMGVKKNSKLILSPCVRVCVQIFAFIYTSVEMAVLI